MLLELNQNIRDAALPLYTPQEPIFNYESSRMQTLAIGN
jgi:hypothetical protein